MKIFPVLIFALSASLSAFAADTSVQEGVGVSDSEKGACEAALLTAKKGALDDAGAIFRVPYENLQELIGGSRVDASDMAELEQLGKLVNVLKVSQLPLDKSEKGNYLCLVRAEFSINMAGVLEHNKKYQGYLPDWLIAPPKILGKRTVISRAKELDGALALAILTYLEENRKDRRFEKAEFKSILTNEDGYTRMLKDASFVSQSIHQEKLNQDVSIKGRIQSYVAEEHDFNYKDIAIISFNAKNKEREIRFFRSGFSLTPDDEQTQITKDTASLDMLVNSLQQSGFTVKYAEVKSGEQKGWYLMLIGDKKHSSNNNVAQ